MATAATVSIVIPAYNEAQRLPQTLDALIAYSKDHPEISEIIVVDDGSRDGTAAVVGEVQKRAPLVKLVSYGPNAGKGYAIRRGVMKATCELLLLTDADLSTPIEELPKLTAALTRSDIAIGSRAVDESLVRVPQNILRRQMGKTFNRLMRLLTGLPFLDTQCGFKLLRTAAGKAILADALVDRFAWDVEMLMLARRRGLTIAEVPVVWINAKGSRVRIVRDSLRMLIDVARIRKRIS